MPWPLTTRQVWAGKPPLGAVPNRSSMLCPANGGLWTLGEGGATVYDSLGLNPPATVTGGSWVSTPTGRGLSLSAATTSVVSIPDCRAQKPAKAITVAVLAKCTGGNATNRTMFCKPATADWSGPYAVYALRLNNSNQLEGWVNDTNTLADSSATFSADGKYHLFAMTYDGATLTLYDGPAIVATLAASVGIGTTTLPLRIGNSTSGGSVESWVGPIDMALMDWRCWTPGEVAQLARTPRAAF